MAHAKMRKVRDSFKNIIMNDCLKTKYKVKFPLKKNQ